MNFDAILGEAKERRRARERTPRLSVATGECGFAVGAEQVVEAVRSELGRRGIVADVVEVGCNGMSHEAVMIDVERPGLPRITYGRIAEDRVPWLIDSRRWPAYVPSSATEAIGTRASGPPPRRAQS